MTVFLCNYNLVIGDKPNNSIRIENVTIVLVNSLFSPQWFGNLVTMQWWNDLWLNEGLATFMEYFSLEKIFQKLSSVSTVFFLFFAYYEC